MLTVTSEDVRSVKFDIVKVSYTMRLLFLMFVTAVCVLFLVRPKVNWFITQAHQYIGRARPAVAK